jgi:heptosyltransferase-2
MESVLVRLPNHVGDACMALPALRLLAHGGLSPVLVGKAWAGDLLAGLGWRFEPIEGPVPRDLRRMRALVAELGGAPRAVLMPNSIGSAVLFRLAGARCAGLATDGRGWLLEAALPEPAPMHEVERFWRVAAGALAHWGLPVQGSGPEPRLALPLARRHEAAANRVIKDAKLPARYALLAPVATGLHKGRVKHWPHFATLVEPLRARGIEPIALPPPNEAEATRAALPGARILPPVTLGAYAALAARAAVVVANDSGVSHVAAAVGARQVTIFGVTEATRTGPWNPRAVNVGALDAWPEPDAVLAAIDAALALP